MNRLGQQEARQPQMISSPPEEDSALVAAILRKDRKATAEFVAPTLTISTGTSGPVWPRCNDQVEDLVHEVFLAAWEGLPGYQGSGPLRAWVLGIARHKVEDYYRARLRAPESIEDGDQEPIAPASASDFHQLLEQDELRKNTWRVMGGLPEQYRMALIWRYWERSSAREMALKTGKTEKAIERLLARARAEFRERWNHVQSS